MNITSRLRSKTRLDSEGTKYKTKDNELVLVPRYTVDKNFPKAVKPLYIEINRPKTRKIRFI